MVSPSNSKRKMFLCSYMYFIQLPSYKTQATFNAVSAKVADKDQTELMHC